MADVYVNGYTRSDGTYVQGHYRSSPNNTTYDNFSTKGNINPYTGQPGYKNPEPKYGTYNSNPYSSSPYSNNKNNDPF